ncbi:hypothetical protein MWH25_08685 [Natroniella acetigena]|uniref:hypothetical protein n=1 Tax=Natroniella acetigena TaxID=52004 RepID=UPI00200A5CC9|nr:hypothetical protein [Natroniella acetigena]MCK8827815.1 hypothetical protein [Natroniella acetigena]
MEKLDNLSNYLNSPKTTDQLHEQLKDNDSDWNREQLELYLTLDKKVKKEKDKWMIGEVSQEERLLNLIRDKLDSKQGIRLDKFVGELPYGLVFSKDDIISLVEGTDDLECPNSMVVTKKQ